MLGLLLILISSFFFPGIIVRIKSIMSGRKGPGIFQPMKDIVRLLRKGNVYSRTTSFIFQIAPLVYFASILTAIIFLPLGRSESIISFNGDFVFFAYLLAIGKFFMIIGALDTGSSFEGMGASREALYSMLVEPAFFILLASFAMLTGYSSFSQIYNALYFNSYLAIFAGFMATYVLVQICMIENSRMPYDDPKTHLELTMIHEVMVLDNSGFDLGIIQYASALKFVIFGSLISNFFLIPEMPFYIYIPIFLVIQMMFAVLVGILESFRARHKMRNNNQAIITLIPIAILIFFSIIMILTKQF
jgi:formate hydrogenlyase subunit 4